jgi:lysozyme
MKRFSRAARTFGALLASWLLCACAPVPGDDIRESRSPLTVCAGTSTVQGVDVSYYQGAVDFRAVRNAGFRFGVARVSDGLSHPDERFAENWSGMASAGLVRGAYQYFEPSEGAREQAALVVQKVGRLGPRDLPVALDAETTGGLTPENLISQFRVWLSMVEQQTGKRPVIYTASYFWDALHDTELNAHALWIASYPASCPDLPSEWKHWTLWQKGTGTVPGIATAVDLDEFDGSLGDLKEFAESRGRSAFDDGGITRSESRVRDPWTNIARPSALEVDASETADGAPPLEPGDGAPPLEPGDGARLPEPGPLRDGSVVGSAAIDADGSAPIGAGGPAPPEATNDDCTAGRRPGCAISQAAPAAARAHAGVLYAALAVLALLALRRRAPTRCPWPMPEARAP